MGKVVKSVMGFVIIAFVLLGILFGMQIMTFIFGNIGVSNDAFLRDVTIPITNLSGVDINSTIGLFTIPEAAEGSFVGEFTVLVALNLDGIVIPPANYTVVAINGTIVNATEAANNDANLTYTFLQKSPEKLIAEAVTNNSLVSIQTYTEQSNTQMNTAAIAITLLILIAVFLIFWKIFIKDRAGKGDSKGGNFA